MSVTITAVCEGWLKAYNPATTKDLYNICTMSAQRRRRRANVVQMLYRLLCMCYIYINVYTLIDGKILYNAHVSFTSFLAFLTNRLLAAICRADINTAHCAEWYRHRNLLCKPKRQYMYTRKVSRYCLLASHGRICVMQLWIFLWSPDSPHGLSDIGLIINNMYTLSLTLQRCNIFI